MLTDQDPEGHGAKANYKLQILKNNGMNNRMAKYINTMERRIVKTQIFGHIVKNEEVKLADQPCPYSLTQEGVHKEEINSLLN